MDISLPATFPQNEFRAFAQSADRFFSAFMSDEALYDNEQKRGHFERSWQAVRYRYRNCSEWNDEFKTLLASPSPGWESGIGDEEFTYKVERCIYSFFMSAVSIFDSFAFCLYYFGNALRPVEFPAVNNPRAITRKSLTSAFSRVFILEPITALLTALPNDNRFHTIDMVRNIVGHRVSGRRSIRSEGVTHEDGTYTSTQEVTWHIHGANGSLALDNELLNRHFEDVTALLTDLVVAARVFAESRP